MNSTIDLVVSPWQKSGDLYIRDVIVFNNYVGWRYMVWRNKSYWSGIFSMIKRSTSIATQFDRLSTADIAMEKLDNYAKKYYNIVFLSQEKFDRMVLLK